MISGFICICDPHGLLAVSEYPSGLLLMVVRAWEGMPASYLDKANWTGCTVTLGPVVDKGWRAGRTQGRQGLPEGPVRQWRREVWAA